MKETYLSVSKEEFVSKGLMLHQSLPSPIMAMFAEDNRQTAGAYRLYTTFYEAKTDQWIHLCLDLPTSDPTFPSLAKEIYSASFFEREIWEMFGLKPQGNPDLRHLRLHDEVWPEGLFPLRKDFILTELKDNTNINYLFIQGKGEGLFEVPVGPIHAGIIGPGHFRFSVAGEPIINLEIRLGFTHRGIEKLLEGKDLAAAIKLVEGVSGDAAFAHSFAFCQAVEKTTERQPTIEANLTRAILLELERLYNHLNDIGGIALDVGFTFASSFAQIMKEKCLQINQQLTGSRYLKGVNEIGGVKNPITGPELKNIAVDLKGLEAILFDSASFMDRVDGTGVLRQKTAEDIGAVGIVARASGLVLDLRSHDRLYQTAGFAPVIQETGDVLARLNVRLLEAKQSISLINSFCQQLAKGEKPSAPFKAKAGFGLGAVEGWRGPVLYWVRLNDNGIIERCKIVDPSFHNWQGLSFAAQGEIIPDFPLCNKSFDLSYSGNDL